MRKKRLLWGILSAFILVLTGCSSNGTAETEYLDTLEQKSILMFQGNPDDSSVGQLYMLTLGEEKEKIADNVLKNEYIMAPGTDTVVYLDKELVLYSKDKKKEKVKLGEKVLPNSYWFSGDEKSVVFASKIDSEEGTSAELYVKPLAGEKIKITSDIDSDWYASKYALNYDSSSIYYLNSEGVFYRKSDGEDKEKIASDVLQFTLNNTVTAYSYSNNQDVSYVKWANDIEPQKIATESIGSVALADNGYVGVFLGEYNFEKGKGELFIAMKGMTPYKIASDVKSIYFSPDGEYLYYLNEENELYSKQIPVVNEKTYEKSQVFIDDLGKSPKSKIGLDVDKFRVDASGENLLFIDKEKKLFYSANQAEKVRIATDIESFMIFQNQIFFLNKDKQLMYNHMLGDADNLSKGNQLLSDKVEMVKTSAYGKFIAFQGGDNPSILLSNDWGKPQVLLENAKDYDQVSFYGGIIYEKKIKYSELVGIYVNELLGRTYVVSPDEKITIYEAGVEKETVSVHTTFADINSITLGSDNENSELYLQPYLFTRDKEGKWKLNDGIDEYDLNIISKETLTAQLDLQKKEGEQRAAAAAMEAALEQKLEDGNSLGQYYYEYGIYISSYEFLYKSPSFGSESVGTFNLSANHEVYDYLVTDSGELWLQVWAESYDYGDGYFWVNASV